MAVRISIVVLICALVALAVFAPATAKPAAASCIVLEYSLDTAAELVEIVIVGEVIDEQAAELPTRVDGITYEAYESTVRVRVALRGNPESEITLSPLGSRGPDCNGGPRLPVGERVLLFIREHNGMLRMFGFESGKYVLTNGEATRVSKLSPPPTPIPVADALRRVAAITDATDEQLEAALAFAGVGPTPAPQPDAEPIPTDAPQPDAEPLPVDMEDGGHPALLIALASALLALLVAALVGLGLRRAR